MRQDTLKIPLLTKLPYVIESSVREDPKFVSIGLEKRVFHKMHPSDEELAEIVSFQVYQHRLTKFNSFIVNSSYRDKGTSGWFGITEYIPV
jgi:hypothetical protein